MIQIVTDSSCDLPEELMRKYNIHSVPVIIGIDGELYQEGVDISAKEFYQRMAKSKKLPHTSQPSPATFAEIFSELSLVGDVLCITVTSGLSGTYQSACLGKKLSGTSVTVFDSLSASLGHGLQVLRAAKLAEAGYKLEEIVRELEKYRSEMKVLILLNTLENIVKGGRLSKFQGALGKLLDIKAILQKNEEGKAVMMKKVRGKKNLLKIAFGEIIRLCPDLSSIDVGITHCNNPEDVAFFEKELRQKCKAGQILINDMGAAIAAYAGEGGMIIAF